MGVGGGERPSSGAATSLAAWRGSAGSEHARRFPNRCARARTHSLVMSRELPSTNWIALLVFVTTGYALSFAEGRVTTLRDLTGAQVDLLPGMMVYAAMAFRIEIVLGCAALFGVFYDSLSA